MLNENEERFHPKQSSSINTGAAQRKETNKTLKTLNKVYFMKGFEGFKNQMSIKRNSQKSKLSFTWFFYGQSFVSSTVYQPFKKTEIITDV